MENKGFYMVVAIIAGLFVVTGAYILSGDFNRDAGVGIDSDLTTDDDMVKQNPKIPQGTAGEVWVGAEGEAFEAKFVETVDVTPDENYDFGAFCRINYVRALDEFVVTFGGARVDREPEDNYEAGHAGGAEGAGGYHYKFYSTDMEYTGKNGDYIYGGGDAATAMVDDIYYHLTGDPIGWKLAAFDAVTFEELDSVSIELDKDEQANDEMVSYANGVLILGGILMDMKQTESDPNKGYGTHNRIYSTDLEFIDKFDLTDTEHINGSSVVFIDGVYHYITSTAYFGDLIVMRYDEDWNFLDSQIIAKDAQWSQGAVYDAERDLIYVAYLKNIQGKRGRESNTYLGVYDRSFNLVETIEVTDFSGVGSLKAGRPSVMLHNNRLYVSYDLVTESDDDWQCTVSVYELE